MIYLTPLHQYPTTATMSISRRLHLYDIAARHGIPILEDDYDHEFHFRSQPLAPLATNDPAGIVIYLSTFSKILFPSARIGFMAVPKRLAPHLIGFRKIMTRQNNSILQDATARWMKSGGFERHLRKMRKTYEERRNFIAETIEIGKSEGLPFSYHLPDGGMAVWLDTGMDSAQIARKAERVDVYVSPEVRYQLKKRSGRYLRLGFANQSPEEIRKGMRLLFDLMKSSLGD